MEYDLDRFKRVQETPPPGYPTYATALEEIRRGKKISHWIWYVFPQLKGLGHSPNAIKYGLADLQEAKAYLADETLENRLREISQALMEHKGQSAYDILGGHTDAIKVKSCMTLFDIVAPNNIFASVLDAFYDGKRDGRTIKLIFNKSEVE